MKVKLIFVILFFIGQSAFSQKFGYIDTEYIMAKMPEYKKASGMMNELTEKWTKDFQSKYNELDKARVKFQQEEILLTPELKKEKLSELAKKEEDLKELNNKVFGIEGSLFQKKKEVLKPILDEIYRSVEKVARKYKLSFIFDKASDLSMFYADPRHDYTDFVMEDMGLITKK
jgi:outer membrane protein